LVIHTFPQPEQFVGTQRGYYYKIKQLENEKYKPSMDFYRAWDEVVAILRDEKNGLEITDLPLRRDMDRLHEIRNDVQHKGSIPNSKELYKHVSLVESFLIDAY